MLFVVITVVVSLFWKDLYVLALYRDPDVRVVQRLELDIKSKVLLPEGETPAMATVTDQAKISQGGVLKNAINGDKVLLYYSAGTAVVYRPSVDKIVSVGPLIVDPSASQVKDAKVFVRNGSGDQQKFTKALNLLRERYPSASISDDGNAARTDYPTTIAIDLSAAKTEFTGAISEFLGAQNGILPISEQKPEADILIIIGKDYRKN